MRLKTEFLALSSLLILAGLSAPTAASASAGELPHLVQDMGVSLLAAGALAIIFAKLHIPSIAAFILAGFLLGPQVSGIITDPETVDSIAQIGFVLLLFVIGLEINIRSLLASGRTIVIAGLMQYPLTLLFGFLVMQLLIMIGLGGIIGEMPLGALYIGIAIAGSSSLLVVKLFQEHFELDTLPGRISLTVLIFQDIWAIVIALVQPNLDHPDVASIVFSFIGIGVLIVIAAALSHTIIKIGFNWIAKIPELMLLGAVSWCFLIVVIGSNIDGMTQMIGFNLHMSVGSGMAALIAGATIASLPFATEIVSKVGLVKDFFVTLFFVGLGITIPAITSFEIPLLALALAVIVMLSRQLVFFPLFYLLGIDQRSAQVTTIRLAQISEFALVIAFLGVELGHIDTRISSVIILAFVFTAILTSPMFLSAYRIYGVMRPVLTALGFKEPAVESLPDSKVTDLLILGLHRDASSLLHELGENHPALIATTTVVDFNVALHDNVRGLGIQVEYGDISNEDSLVQAGALNAKVIVCTISDDLLRGIRNVELVRMLRRLNPTATIIANAISIHEYDQVKAAGADIVYMARLEVARSLCEAVGHAMTGTVDEYLNKQMQRSGTPSSRREVFN